ncbi:MAG: hypothetical protein GX204_06580 [Acholeplasmataceae bacterium]|nr:hypothetical protein [Acholeplasmataceae bacterium]
MKKSIFAKSLFFVMFAFLLVLTSCNDKSSTEALEVALRDEESYLNCEIELYTKSEVNGLTIENETIIKVDGDKIYTETNSALFEYYCYLIKKDNKFYMATKFMLNEWIVVELETDESETIDFGEFSAEDFELDKEDNYYVLKSAKLEEYMQKIIDEESLLEEFEDASELDLIDFNLKLLIKDERVEKVIYSAVFKAGDMEMSIECEMTYSNFGNVTVEIPDEVNEAIEEYE